MWTASETSGGAVDTGCGSVSGLYAYRFGDTKERVATTRSVDITPGAVLTFSVRFGNGRGLPKDRLCQAVANDDAIEVSYAVGEPGQANPVFKRLGTYPAATREKRRGGWGPWVRNVKWQQVQIQLDYDHFRGALHDNTRFRFQQLGQEGHWALDNVKVRRFPTPVRPSQDSDVLMLDDMHSSKDATPQFGMQQWYWNMRETNGRVSNVCGGQTFPLDDQLRTTFAPSNSTGAVFEASLELAGSTAADLDIPARRAHLARWLGNELGVASDMVTIAQIEDVVENPQTVDFDMTLAGYNVDTFTLDVRRECKAALGKLFGVDPKKIALDLGHNGGLMAGAALGMRFKSRPRQAQGNAAVTVAVAVRVPSIAVAQYVARTVRKAIKGADEFTAALQEAGLRWLKDVSINADAVLKADVSFDALTSKMSANVQRASQPEWEKEKDIMAAHKSRSVNLAKGRDMRFQRALATLGGRAHRRRLLAAADNATDSDNATDDTNATSNATNTTEPDNADESENSATPAMATTSNDTSADTTKYAASDFSGNVGGNAPVVLQSAQADAEEFEEKEGVAGGDLGDAAEGPDDGLPRVRVAATVTAVGWSKTATMEARIRSIFGKAGRWGLSSNPAVQRLSQGAGLEMIARGLVLRVKRLPNAAGAAPTVAAKRRSMAFTARAGVARVASTVALSLRDGASVMYTLKMGANGKVAQDVRGGKPIELQYRSQDNDPWRTVTGGAVETSGDSPVHYAEFRRVLVDLSETTAPGISKSNTTRLRWRQAAGNGTPGDPWAIGSVMVAVRTRRIGMEDDMVDLERTGFCRSEPRALVPYAYGHGSGGQGSGVYFSGPIGSKPTMRSIMAFHPPFRVTMSVEKNAHCANQFIALSTKKEDFEWSWEPQPDSVKFVWNCDVKTLILPTGAPAPAVVDAEAILAAAANQTSVVDDSSTLATTCAATGTFRILAQADVDGRVAFMDDGGCTLLSSTAPSVVKLLGNAVEKPLYVYVGAAMSVNASQVDEPPGGRAFVRNVVVSGVGSTSLLSKRDPASCPKIPVACVVSAWSGWGGCFPKCGDHGDRLAGNHTRTRTIVKPALNGGDCATLSDTEMCPACGDDCIVSEWADWGRCNVPCNTGNRSRTRIVMSPAKPGSHFGKDTCPPLVELAVNSCNHHQCGQDCVVSEWDPWGACSTPCGGTRVRRRKIWSPPTIGPPAGLFCPPLNETQKCVADPPGTNCLVPAQPTPVTESHCSKLTTCGACSGQRDCGWCPSSRKCFLGTSKGPKPVWIGNAGWMEDPMKAFMYATNCSSWQFSTCNDEPSEPCRRHKGCWSCLNDAFCGWCAGSSTCSEGDTAGSMSQFCPRGWAYSPVRQPTAGYFERSDTRLDPWQAQRERKFVHQFCLANDQQTRNALQDRSDQEKLRLKQLHAKRDTCSPCAGIWPMCDCGGNLQRAKPVPLTPDMVKFKYVPTSAAAGEGSAGERDEALDADPAWSEATAKEEARKQKARGRAVEEATKRHVREIEAARLAVEAAEREGEEKIKREEHVKEEGRKRWMNATRESEQSSKKRAEESSKRTAGLGEKQDIADEETTKVKAAAVARELAWAKAERDRQDEFKAKKEQEESTKKANIEKAELEAREAAEKAMEKTLEEESKRLGREGQAAKAAVARAQADLEAAKNKDYGDTKMRDAILEQMSSMIRKSEAKRDEADAKREEAKTKATQAAEESKKSVAAAKSGEEKGKTQLRLSAEKGQVMFRAAKAAAQTLLATQDAAKAVTAQATNKLAGLLRQITLTIQVDGVSPTTFKSKMREAMLQALAFRAEVPVSAVRVITEGSDPLPESKQPELLLQLAERRTSTAAHTVAVASSTSVMVAVTGIKPADAKAVASDLVLYIDEQLGRAIGLEGGATARSTSLPMIEASKATAGTSAISESVTIARTSWFLVGDLQASPLPGSDLPKMWENVAAETWKAARAAATAVKTKLFPTGAWLPPMLMRSLALAAQADTYDSKCAAPEATSKAGTIVADTLAVVATSGVRRAWRPR